MLLGYPWCYNVSTPFIPLRSMMHVYPDIFCCAMFGQKIRKICFAIYLSDFYIPVRYPFLYPKLVHFNVPYFTQAPATSNALSRTSIRTNPDPK